MAVEQSCIHAHNHAQREHAAGGEERRAESDQTHLCGRLQFKYGCSQQGYQMLQPYDATRKTTRLYKVMTHLLQVVLLNAYQVFKKHKGSTMDFLAFQYQVISDLYTDNPAPQQDLPHCEDVARLFERHFPVNIAEAVGKRSSGRKCKVCTSKGRIKESSLLCGQCPSNSKPTLCVSPCFQVYHT